MLISSRAVDILSWAKDVGVTPKEFMKSDKLFDRKGFPVDLLKAVPEDTLWMPGPMSLSAPLEKALGIKLGVVQKGSMVFLYGEYLNKRVEVAAATEEEAVLKFLQGVRDATQSRAVSSG